MTAPGEISWQGSNKDIEAQARVAIPDLFSGRRRGAIWSGSMGISQETLNVRLVKSLLTNHLKKRAM
jgi:hypothetical protein